MHQYIFKFQFEDVVPEQQLVALRRAVSDAPGVTEVYVGEMGLRSYVITEVQVKDPLRQEDALNLAERYIGAAGIGIEWETSVEQM